MAFLGQMKNGMVVFDGRVELPVGALVKVELLGDLSQQDPAQANQALFDRSRPTVVQGEQRLDDVAAQIAPALYQIQEKKSKFRRLLKHFLQGLLFLCLISWFFSDKSWSGFFGTLALLFCSINIVAALGLIWLTRWASREERRLRQFSISTMLLMLFCAGLYFGIVRWLALYSGYMGPVSSDEQIWAIAGTMFAFSVLSIFAIPLMLRMTESLLWSLVWLQKKPSVRRLIMALLRSRRR